MLINSKFTRPIRSFIRRDGRMTQAQKKAFDSLWPEIGLNLQDQFLNFKDIFNREAPTVLEIGFGSGHSLLEMAKTHPEQNFIGIETHKPGVGSLCLGIQLHQINNIRLFYADAIEVLERCIAERSLDVVQIFFPDPWPKRKHHKRRLIQSPFIQLLISKIKSGGTVHVATDWEDYALAIMKLLSETPGLINLAGVGKYANRSGQRPVLTKFEQRGRRDGREIWEFQFGKGVEGKM